MIKKEDLIKKITDELDISNMPKSSQENIITKLGENILKKLMIDVFDEIPKEKHNDFNVLLKSGEMDNVYKFLNEEIANFDDFINNSAKKTITEFKELAGIS